MLASLPTRSVSYDHGETITSHDQQNECTVIVSGMALLRSAAKAPAPVSGLYVPADTPDLASIALDQLDHDIVAQGSCLVQRVPLDALRELASSSPGLALALWRRTAMDARIHRAWLAAAVLQTAPRIAHLICEIHVRLERVGLARNGSFNLPLEQKDLAHILGISRAHANREIQVLRAQGLLSWNRRELNICDIDKLRDLGHFDPSYLWLHRPPLEGRAPNVTA
ncbi:Crp/Fnr family transcriptional regulator [Roseivivax halodurans]|uniref:Crp/Fnr family transcriptional regulator n=1 Tax=Roseivivax halodurans TaxID=93683 RepID=UPI001B7FAF8C|nr:Crp/Fnr family transcriptional regulator [Roseivivax halodurans]